MNRDMMDRLSQMQEQLAKAQEDMENRVTQATAGGGAVKVEITGSFKVKSLSINPEVVDPDDMGMLEDLVIAAMNEALAQVQALQSEQFSGVTGGLNIPGLDAGAGGGGGTPVNRASRRANKR